MKEQKKKSYGAEWKSTEKPTFVSLTDSNEWNTTKSNKHEMHLLQIAAAIARSPAVSVSDTPLTTFRKTA